MAGPAPPPPQPPPLQTDVSVPSSPQLEDGTTGRLSLLLNGRDSNGIRLDFKIDNSTKQKMDAGTYRATGSDGKEYTLEPLTMHSRVVVKPAPP